MIRPNDVVSIPHFSRRHLKVRYASKFRLKAINEFGQFIFFDENGFVNPSDVGPLVFKVEGAYENVLDSLEHRIDDLILKTKEVYKFRESEVYNGHHFERALQDIKEELIEVHRLKMDYCA